MQIDDTAGKVAFEVLRGDVVGRVGLPSGGEPGGVGEFVEADRPSQSVISAVPSYVWPSSITVAPVNAETAVAVSRAPCAFT